MARTRDYDDDDKKGMAWLFDFSYRGDLDSALKIICQVTVAGCAVILLKALDGETCGRGWKWYLPQTWGTPVGCATRGLVRTIPTPEYSFTDEVSGTAENGSTIVGPPTPQQ